MLKAIALLSALFTSPAASAETFTHLLPTVREKCEFHGSAGSCPSHSVPAFTEPSEGKRLMSLPTAMMPASPLDLSLNGYDVLSFLGSSGGVLSDEHLLLVFETKGEWVRLRAKPHLPWNGRPVWIKRGPFTGELIARSAIPHDVLAQADVHAQEAGPSVWVFPGSKTELIGPPAAPPVAAPVPPAPPVSVASKPRLFHVDKIVNTSVFVDLGTAGSHGNNGRIRNLMIISGSGAETAKLERETKHCEYVCGGPDLDETEPTCHFVGEYKTAKPLTGWRESVALVDGGSVTDARYAAQARLADPIAFSRKFIPTETEKEALRDQPGGLEWLEAGAKPGEIEFHSLNSGGGPQQLAPLGTVLEAGPYRRARFSFGLNVVFRGSDFIIAWQGEKTREEAAMQKLLGSLSWKKLGLPLEQQLKQWESKKYSYSDLEQGPEGGVVGVRWKQGDQTWAYDRMVLTSRTLKGLSAQDCESAVLEPFTTIRCGTQSVRYAYDGHRKFEVVGRQGEKLGLDLRNVQVLSSFRRDGRTNFIVKVMDDHGESVQLLRESPSGWELEPTFGDYPTDC